MSNGYQLVNFCEFDKYAEKSYCAVHGVDPSLNLGDITKVDETNLAPFNMICGGSPCQDFSVAGSQKGSKWVCNECGHTYNPLTVHYSSRRIIRANKPNWCIYENVKNLVGKKFKDTFQMFLDELDAYGYNCYYQVLNAKDFGVPQNRERVYVIAIKKELDNGKFKFPVPFDSDVSLKDILEEDVNAKYYIDSPKATELIEELKENGKLEQNVSRTIRSGGERVAT